MSLLQRLSAAKHAFNNPQAKITTSKHLADYIQYHDSVGSPLEVSAVLRCVDLLSSSLAMLPFRVVGLESREEVKTHPLHFKLKFEPNNWQTSYEFRKLMEVRRIMHGDSYALVVRAGLSVVGMQPLDNARVKVKQNNDWSLSYEIKRPNNEWVPIPAQDILHLRDISVDGLEGCSRTKLVRSAIATAKAAENAQRNIFEKGTMVGGFVEHPGALGDDAYLRLKKQMDERSGPEHAGEWWLLEDGMKAAQFALTARDAQTNETRNQQIEDIARAFGVPRPLLMMDDTSWGSGIEQLATLFVRFGLAPGMVCWEQATRRVLLTRQEKTKLDLDIDERVLLRGSLKDQAEYFAKASGAGGHMPWLEANEIRQTTGSAPHKDGYGLNQMGQETSNATTE